MEQTKWVAEEGKDLTEELKVVNGLFPEASATDETIVKQVKEDLKNHDSLSIVIKNASLKEEERVQTLNAKYFNLKPRTRLRSTLEVEMKLIHNPRSRNEYFGKIVIVNGSFSEENIQVSKDWHFSENENFIDLQGNAGCIPERFCINKQAYSENENGSVSKYLQADEVFMYIKETEVMPELNQIKKSLQSYREQTKFLQNINESMMFSNKRLQEDLEEKDTDYQKILLISKDILKEKRAI